MGQTVVFCAFLGHSLIHVPGMATAYWYSPVVFTREG